MLGLLWCDDADEAAILTVMLQRAGLSVEVADPNGDGYWPRGWQAAEVLVLAAREPDLVAAVSRLRRDTDGLLLAVLGPTDEDTLCALYDAGADLVVTRPYSVRLLLRQLRVLLRRARGLSALGLPTLTVGDLRLDPASRVVQVGEGMPRRLTQLEFRLLYTLMMHPGQTLPAATLVERVWGYGGDGGLDLVRGLVSRLRHKVEREPGSPRYVVTIPGVGYRLDVGLE